MQEYAELSPPSSSLVLSPDVAESGDATQPLSKRVLKRAVDLLIALPLLVLLLPVILIAALTIALVDRHRPFFCDRRVGLAGRQFACLKLRTLRDDPAVLERYLARHPGEAELYRASRKLRHDPRRTRLGTLLRKLSIDEAPQLINVIIGQMSMVGPRPVTWSELATREAPHDLLLARPGLTGLWQISGRSNLREGDRDRYDLYYARHWTLRLDLSIIVRTPHAVLTGRGAR
jgi:exopolysaccharide production protein ExoY